MTAAVCDHPMTVVSLFDGIGGGPLAFTRAGAVVVATCEIDKAAAGVAADHFPEAKHFADVTELTADDLLAAGFCPVCGIIVAGFPCQDLSVAGRRAGLDGARSGLFFEIVRIARDLRPRWLVLENVPGLLSSVCVCPGDGVCGARCTAAHPVPGGACGRVRGRGRGRCVEIHGGAMGAVLGAVAQLGYGFAYRVLDAQHFGVPQRRRRVFVVGCLGDGAAPAEILLEPEGRERDPGPSGGARADAAESADGRADGARREVVAALGLSGIGGNGGPDDNAAQGGHIVAFQGHGTNVGPMGTLRAGSGTVAGGVPSTAAAVRRLTPTECERLQGFPDGWTARSGGRPQADSARYRQLGNSFAVPVVEWISRRLVAVNRER